MKSFMFSFSCGRLVLAGAAGGAATINLQQNTHMFSIWQTEWLAARVVGVSIVGV